MIQTNFKIIIEYDGTYFSGWQIQNEKFTNRVSVDEQMQKKFINTQKFTTIQGELENALSIILNQKIKIIGSGRTDAGVHAFGQAANFHAETDISPQNLLKALNSIIKTPIVVRSCQIVSSDFHARYSAVSKEYHYNILNSDLPCAVGKDYVWHIRQALDIEKMNECCDMLIGEHDFKSFEAGGSPRSSTVRTIYSAGFYIDADIFSIYNIAPISDFRKNIVFKIVGSGFLRFMVRNIVGTLVMAGLSKITPEDFRYILDKKNRTLAGATAPARGLFLMRVNYN